jgi:hypothetical protein
MTKTIPYNNEVTELHDPETNVTLVGIVREGERHGRVQIEFGRAVIDTLSSCERHRWPERCRWFATASTSGDS